MLSVDETTSRHNAVVERYATARASARQFRRHSAITTCACPSGSRSAPWSRTARRPWGFVVAAVIVLVLTPLVARLAPRDRRGRRPGRPPARAQAAACRASAGSRSSSAILVPALHLRRPRRPLPRDPDRHAAGRRARPRRRHPRHPRRASSWSAIVAIALIPVVGYDVTLRPRDAAGDRRPRPRLGRVPAHDPLDRGPREPREPDRRDGRARRRASSPSPPASFAILGGLLRPRRTPRRCPRSSAARRWRSCVFNYHPAKIFMGDSGALALGFLLAAIAVQGVLKTAATIALVGAAARAGGADPRHVVRRAQAAQVPARAVGRRPQPLLPPVHAHRLLAAAHGRVPARLGGAARRPTRSCCASCRRGRTATGTCSNTLIAARGGAGRARARRSGWSTRSRSSRTATCARSGCGASCATSHRLPPTAWSAEKTGEPWRAP